MQRQGLARVIVASSVGTVIEFYDFFIFASLAATIAAHFFPPDRPTFAYLSTLATYGVGLAVRPLGSLAFGRLGDTVGRKTTFLVTLLMMGTATAAIGVLPTYATIGAAAPLLLILLRVIQGLALGGEYAGAATYVAEHAPEDQRGYYTSFIQLTPTVGLFASSLIVLAIRRALGEPSFTDWGWRVPFLISLVFVAISYYIRVRLEESPVFVAMKEQGTLSRAPIRESYATAEKWKLFAVILFGVTAGQAVLATTTQVYVLFFLQRVLKVPADESYRIVAGALLLVMPLFPLLGRLSDRIGRKPLMIAGNLLAVVLLYPIYWLMTVNTGNAVLLTLLVFAQMVPFVILYAPLAAFLVEAFPPNVRYTSISLPYNLGNGWFGGFLPLIATALVAKTGSPLAWLAYPIGVALITVVVSVAYLGGVSRGQVR
ncbi:MAG TPA: MFS transporter [Gemmatimonadaceae bacterium]|nr:MFS transporter [Gemmatimonadaceae bacterium]